MDYQPYEHISKETLARIYKIVKVCQEIGLNYGTIFNDVDNGDFALFVLSSETDIVAIGCSPNCYMVEHESDDKEAQLYLVTNIRNLLVKLKSMGLSGYKKRSK